MPSGGPVWLEQTRVLVMVTDAALEASLKAARPLDWTLPWGAFHAGVAGLGAAFEAIEVCQPARSLPWWPHAPNMNANKPGAPQGHVIVDSVNTR